jgi:hypothetical protein
MPTYYVDYTNGVDTLPGLREPTTGHYHAEAGSDNTTTVCATSLTGTAEDGTAYVGAFIWNRTRSAGAIISAYVHLTHTLTHGAIVGNVTTDEFYIIKAWKTTSKAATTCAAGDIAYIRAGLTDTLAAVVDFTNDGTVTSKISLIGTGTGTATLETTDETATEMWHDASTVRPIINGNNAANYVNISADDYWTLKNLDIRNTNTGSYGCLNIATSNDLYVENCIIRDSANASGYNVYMNSSSALNTKFVSCQFKNANQANVVISFDGRWTFNSCTFDSGALVTNYGFFIISNTGFQLYLNNCIFGATSAHNTNDIYIQSGFSGKVIARNCIWTKTHAFAGTNDLIGGIWSEDDNGVYGAQTIWLPTGTITKDTGVVRAGGSISSAKLMPTSTLSSRQGLCVSGDINVPDFSIWCDAIPTTITVYIRSVTTWGGTYPTAAQLWTETEYVTDDTTGAITRTTALSSQVLADDSTWVGFTCGSFTPHVAGWVNIKVKLAKYVAANGIYVDIRPVIS